MNSAHRQCFDEIFVRLMYTKICLCLILFGKTVSCIEGNNDCIKNGKIAMASCQGKKVRMFLSDLNIYLLKKLQCNCLLLVAFEVWVIWEGFFSPIQLLYISIF